MMPCQLKQQILAYNYVIIFLWIDKNVTRDSLRLRFCLVKGYGIFIAFALLNVIISPLFICKT